MNRSASTLLLSGLIAVFSSGAIAQAPAAADGKPRMEHRHGQHDPAKMQEKIAKRLADFKTKLAITSAQESAWTTFAAAMQPPATRPARPTREEMAAMTTPVRIDKMRTLRAQRQSMMDTRADAAKAFYGVLSADQKKTFDAAAMRMMGGKGGKGGKGGHGHH